MPLLETKGAGSAQGFGLSLGSAEAVYVEDVFSTYLYTGNGSTQTITNGIDLDGEGGLVWIKDRGTPATHGLYDSERGSTARLDTTNTNGQSIYADSITSFNASGFSIGARADLNTSSNIYVSWTFRKQPKFFDVVTYTGNGVTGRTVAHDLGSAPGCIIVKRTDSTGDWAVYHRGVNGGTNPQDYKILLNLTNAQALDNWWNNTLPTSSSFQLSSDPTVNQNGATYVAYLFAHNAGGFGLTGLDNVISCGSYTGNGTSVNNITLGYEPQWILIKDTTSAYKWLLMDNMRGLSMGTSSAVLSPNSSDAETANGAIEPTATGFTLTGGGGFLNGSGDTYIYIAIRRGPMKVPTSGTEVFSPNLSSTYDAVNTTGFAIDAQIWAVRGGIARNSLVVDRLRGVGTGGSTNDGPFLSTALTDAELGSGSNTSRSWNNTGFRTPGYAGSVPEVFWSFRRAPGFFDEVCYTGNGVSGRTLNHNLTVTPELLIIKSRNITNTWNVQTVAAGWNKFGYLSSDQAFGTDSFLTADPTSTALFLQSFAQVNGSGNTYVAYLFATAAGVSKVGSYTGTGTTQTINCGFTAGARFVLIKRTDSTGDWYVWDSARGIVAGNDPYLLLNSTAAEVTNTDYVDTASTGFEISSTAPAAINASGGTFIFLAIA